MGIVVEVLICMLWLATKEQQSSFHCYLMLHLHAKVKQGTAAMDAITILDFSKISNYTIIHFSVKYFARS